MQSVRDELEFILSAFVERDLPGVLVVACDAVASLQVVQLLALLDEGSETDLFVTCAGRAPDAAALVDAVAEELAHQQVLLAEQCGANAPLSPLALAPGSPAARMQALIEQVLGSLPPGDHRLVWSLVPSELPSDFSAALAEPLLRAKLDPRVRLVLRAEPTSRSFELARAWPDEHVLAYRLDFSAGDAVAAAVRTASDTTSPAEDRAHALLELAYLDFGHGRFTQAARNFRGCAEFHAHRGDAVMEALALAGVADVERARGELAAARLTYETALLKAAPTRAFPAILQIAVALADTCASLQQFADAEGYYRLADRLAAALLRPHTRADIYESIGVCRSAQGDEAEARQFWGRAVELCRAIDYPKRLCSTQARLAAAREREPARNSHVHALAQEVRSC